jgi:arylsulfatase A-like enzyme
MDETIGGILDLLDAFKIADNTLVIFFSDNGRLNRFGQIGMHVPFIARWPGHIPAGTTNSDFVTTLDIFPTLLAAAQVPDPEGIKLDGFDSLPVLEGKKRSLREEMFWHERDRKAVRIGQYKWIDAPGESGLFDLSSDPDEKHDLSAERPELLAKFKRRFDRWDAEMNAAEPRGPFRDY